MTIRKILFLTFALLVCVKMGAQTTDAEKAEKLKADNSYVTGEGYGATLEEAGKDYHQSALLFGCEDHRGQSERSGGHGECD